MSERKQRTAAGMREQMTHRYGDGLHHKHNKNHHAYRQHFRSHPVENQSYLTEQEATQKSTGHIRELKLKKVRKRLDKDGFH